MKFDFLKASIISLFAVLVLFLFIQWIFPFEFAEVCSNETGECKLIRVEPFEGFNIFQYLLPIGVGFFVYLQLRKLE